MDEILGIDLGTTNSVVSILYDTAPKVLPVEDDRMILPSAVGVDADGNLLLGTAARNQALMAPERTILSVKRQMGQDLRLKLGDKSLSPQEVSAILLRTLKERAEQQLGHPVQKAVITVPAFFSENQRAATREAGELAGLEVVRIINEPTAAALMYEPDGEAAEQLLIYDLGGGTFDVSIVRIERGVVEVLSSHGDTQLGGDDFDQLLLDHVCDQFKQQHDGLDLRQIATARSRIRQAVEAAKIRLSTEAFTTIQEAFIAEHKGEPVNLETTIDRSDYEELIEPLLRKTIENVDEALADAKILPKDVDKVILVGGSTRTPRVQELLTQQLGQSPHLEIDPDLCVSMGAAIQGGLISGIDVGPVLVDITPRTLGVRVLGRMGGVLSDRCFSPLIPRNTALPACRSNMYQTTHQGQEAVIIDVFQGESEDVNLNEQVGSFELEGLDKNAPANSKVLVRFDLSLDGTLTVTAVERATLLEKQLTIDNAITRFRANSRQEAKQRLAEVLGIDPTADTSDQDDLPAPIRERLQRGQTLLSKADRLIQQASQDDAAEIKQWAQQLQAAMSDKSESKIDTAAEKLDDILFYLEDA